MPTDLLIAKTLIGMLAAQIRALRDDERGMTTETVIITAVLASLALAVTAIIVAKVTAKANSIPLE